MKMNRQRSSLMVETLIIAILMNVYIVCINGQAQQQQQQQRPPMPPPSHEGHAHQQQEQQHMPPQQGGFPQQQMGQYNPQDWPTSFPKPIIGIDRDEESLKKAN